MFGTDLGSYVRSSSRCVTSAVKDNVPVEFELHRAPRPAGRHHSRDAGQHPAIAEQEVEIASLKAEIIDSDKALAEAKGKVAKLRDCLATPGSSFSIGQVVYSRDELKDDLARRFDVRRRPNAPPASSGCSATARRASRRRCRRWTHPPASGRSWKARSPRWRASTSSCRWRRSAAASVDHSKLAQTEKLIADIKKQLDVAERVLAHEAKFVDPIPVETR